MTTGDSTIDMTGALSFSSARRTFEHEMVQTIEGLLVRGMDLRVPHAASLAVNLGLPSGVTEALFLHVYTPSQLRMDVTTTDATAPGPIRMQVKGHTVITFAAGGGLAALSFTNAGTTDDVNILVELGCLGSATDEVPDFWG